MAVMQLAEPSDRLPRRGFFRRHWVALSALAVLLLGGLVKFRFHATVHSTGTSGHILVCGLIEGQVSCACFETALPFRYPVTLPALASPRYGRWPGMSWDGPRSFGVIVPLWMPILLGVGWMGWSERRYRRCGLRRKEAAAESDAFSVESV